MRDFKTRRDFSSYIRQQPIPSVHETGFCQLHKMECPFPCFLDYFPESQATKTLLANKVKLSFPTFPSGSLGLLLVLLVYLMTCIIEESIQLCIMEKLPNNNNINKRCLILSLSGKRILELGRPCFIHWFYEYSGSQAPSRSLLYHSYDPIELLIL